MGKNLLKRRYFSFFFWSILGIPIYTVISFTHYRVKDVKSIYLKDGDQLIIETFQDLGILYQMDIDDLRIINEEAISFLVGVDRFTVLERRPTILFIRYATENISDFDLFEKIILEKYYLVY